MHCRALTHGVPRNSRAKSFPSPTPASLGPQLPKRKAHEQPYGRSLGPAPRLCLRHTTRSPAHGAAPARPEGAPGHAGTPCLRFGPVQGRHRQGPTRAEPRWWEAGDPAHLCSGASPLQFTREPHARLGDRAFLFGALEQETRRLLREASCSRQCGNTK